MNLKVIGFSVAIILVALIITTTVLMSSYKGDLTICSSTANMQREEINRLNSELETTENDLENKDQELDMMSSELDEVLFWKEPVCEVRSREGLYFKEDHYECYYKKEFAEIISFDLNESQNFNESKYLDYMKDFLDEEYSLVPYGEKGYNVTYYKISVTSQDEILTEYEEGQRPAWFTEQN